MAEEWLHAECSSLCRLVYLQLPLLQVRGRGGRALQAPRPPLLLPALNLVLTLTVTFKCSPPQPLYQISEMGPATLSPFSEGRLKGGRQGCK